MTKEIEKLKKQKAKAEKNDNIREVSELCNVLGEQYAQIGDYESALEEHTQELHISEALEDVMGAGVAHRKIGECHCELGHYNKALKHQRLHLQKAQSVNNNVEVQRAYATIGRTYLVQGEAIKDGTTDEPGSAAGILKQAQQAFEKALEVCEQLRNAINTQDYAAMKARLFLNIGLVLDTRGNMARCVEYMKRANSLAERHNLHVEQYLIQTSLAGMYRRSNLGQALRCLEGAIKSAQKVKDKDSESEALTTKSLVFCEQGDFSAARRCLRKAYKKKSNSHEYVCKVYKAVVVLSRLDAKLKSSSEDVGLENQMKIYEKMGDTACSISNYKQALQHYHKMLECGEVQGLEAQQLVPVFVSLAQTYLDLKQYLQAVTYFQREVEGREAEPEQQARTLLNIAEAQEYGKAEYVEVKKSYMAAYRKAAEANHHRLQATALRSLAVCQKNYKEDADQQHTQAQLQDLESKYGITEEDDEEPEEDSERRGEEEHDEEVDLNDLSDSDDSDQEEEFDRAQVSATGRAKRVKASLTKRNEKGETPLHRACISGTLKRVRTLVEQGHPINIRDYTGWTPLHEACNHNFPEVAEYLVDHGASINDRGGEQCDGTTPLHDACNNGSIEIINMLVKKGANVHAKDDNGNTALDCLKELEKRMWGELTAQEKLMVNATKTLLRNTMTGNNPHMSPDLPRTNAEHCQQGALPSSVFDEEMEEEDLPSMSSHRAQRRQQRAGTRFSRPNVEVSDSDDDEPADNNDDLVSDNETRDQENRFLDIESSQSSSQSVRVNHSRAGHRTRAAISDDEDSERLELMDEDSENLYANPALEDIAPLDPSAATDVYRETIATIGSSALRNTQERRSTGRGPRETHIPALINEGDYVDDDWLVEDVQPSSRRRGHIDSFFGSLKMNSNTSQRAKPKSNKRTSGDGKGSNKKRTESHESQSAKRKRRSESPGHVQEKENNEPDLDLPTFDSDFDSDFVMDDLLFMDEDSNNSNDYHGIPVSTSSAPLRPKPKKQMKLTSMGVDRTKNRLSLNKSRERTFSETSVINSQVNSQVPNSQPSVSSGPLMRLNVKINDRNILVPVIPSCDISPTIAWLAREAAERYYKLFNMRPVLSLSTSGGAMLAPDDQISYMLADQEMVVATVEGWDMTPLPQRYVDACKVHKVVIYRNIKSLLQMCSNTGSLSLEDLALRPQHMRPIFRALQGQNALKELNIQGNKMEDAGFQELVKILESLPNLRRLGVSGCGITSTGLQYLAEALTPRTNTSLPLQSCEELDVSYNSVGDGSMLSMATVVRHLPALTSLVMRCCHLTAKYFQQHRLTLADALQSHNLQSMDMSYNKLGSTGVELLLKCLNSTKITCLRLNSVITTSSANHLTKHILNYTSQIGCSLQELNLESCMLNEDHVPEICRLLSTCPSVKSLWLGNNPKLSVADMTGIVSSSCGNEQSQLQQLYFPACGVQNIDTAFIDAINDKLHHAYPLNRLIFTKAHLDTDNQILQEIWNNNWGENAVCHFEGSLIKLSVKDK